MKLELDISQELYDDIQVCADYKKLKFDEYVAIAISTYVVRDLKAIFVNEEIDADDV
jgi:hypothetical protein